MFALALAVAAACAALGCDSGSQRSTQPNLLLVTVDSLRADRLGCYGGTPGVGARICALGDDGIRYVWAFATASTSAPAVATILTSRYPSEHGVRAAPASFLRSNIITLAEELRAAGYLTTAVVSSPELNRSRNLHQGFARFDDRMSETRGTGHLTRQAAETTDAALASVRGTERPWFLWVHYRDLHGPYASPADGPTAWPSAPGRSFDQAIDRELPILDDESGRGGIPRSQAIDGLSRRSHYEAVYDEVLRRVDREIGRLLDELQARTTLSECCSRRITAWPSEKTTAISSTVTLWGWSRSGFRCCGDRPASARRRPDGAERGIPGDVLSSPRTPTDVRAGEHPRGRPTLLAAGDVPASEAFAGHRLPSKASEAPSDRIEPLFAEHPRRIALVSGSHYYARDREASLIVVTNGGDGEPPPRRGRPRASGRPDRRAVGALGRGRERGLGAPQSRLPAASFLRSGAPRGNCPLPRATGRGLHRVRGSPIRVKNHPSSNAHDLGTLYLLDFFWDL